MVLQPFSVQGLQNPGLSAASQLIGTGIANASESLRQRGVNNNLLLRQFLQDATEQQKSKLALQAEGQRLQAEAPGKLLNQAKTAKELAGLTYGSATDDTGKALADLINQQGDATVMKLLGLQNGTGQTPAPTQGPGLLRRMGRGIKNLFNGDDESEAAPQMGESELMEDINAPQPKQNEQGAFMGGAATSEPAPYASKYDQSPAGRQTIAETSKKEADAKSAGFTARKGELNDFSDEFLGKGIEDQKGATGKYPQAKDAMGEPMSIPLTPRLKGLRYSYATSSPETRSKIDEKTQNAIQTIDSLKDLTEASVRLRQSGWFEKAQRSGLMDNGPLGQVFRLSASIKDQIDPSVVADMELYNASKAAAIAKAGQNQSANSISNKDVEGMIKTLGDASMPTQMFLDTISRNLGDMYGATLVDAAKSGVNFNQLHKGYQDVTGGVPFDLESGSPSQNAKQLILKHYSQIVGRGMNYQPKQAAPSGTTPQKKFNLGEYEQYL